MIFVLPFLKRTDDDVYNLRMAIRSLFQWRYGFTDKLFVVGNTPAHVKEEFHSKNISYIDYSQKPKSYSPKEVLSKVVYSFNFFPEDEFILIHDDMFLVKETTDEMLKTIYHRNTSFTEIQDAHGFEFFLNYSYYLVAKKRDEVITDFVTHMPFFFRKNKVLDIIAEYGLLDQATGPAVFENIYYNHFKDEISSVPYDDYVYRVHSREGEGSTFSAEALNSSSSCFIFNYNDDGFQSNEDSIRKFFTESLFS